MSSVIVNFFVFLNEKGPCNIVGKHSWSRRISDTAFVRLGFVDPLRWHAFWLLIRGRMKKESDDISTNNTISKPRKKESDDIWTNNTISKPSMRNIKQNLSRLKKSLNRSISQTVKVNRRSPLTWQFGCVVDDSKFTTKQFRFNNFVPCRLCLSIVLLFVTKHRQLQREKKQ